MGSSAPGVKAALQVVLVGLHPDPVLVTYGAPGAFQPPEIVALLDQRVTVERPTMSPARPREEIVETDVVFSVFTAGDAEAQQLATERAFEMLGPFIDYFKTKPNETLSGACREAWVTGYVLNESTVPTKDGIAGRLSEITATVTSRTRI